jgi:hypothetical protein
MGMTNSDLESAYAQFLGNGHSAALRAIYTLGYAKGAGLAVDDNLPDHARIQAAPTSAEKTTLSKNGKIKKPD